MNFIGVDIGGTVTKAGIYNELGQEIHVASQYAQVLSEQPGFTERNMHELWDTVCRVIKKALYESQVPPLSPGAGVCQKMVSRRYRQAGIPKRIAAAVDRTSGIATGVAESA